MKTLWGLDLRLFRGISRGLLRKPCGSVHCCVLWGKLVPWIVERAGVPKFEPWDFTHRIYEARVDGIVQFSLKGRWGLGGGPLRSVSRSGDTLSGDLFWRRKCRWIIRRAGGWGGESSVCFFFLLGRWSILMRARLGLSQIVSTMWFRFV
jgi:hypothetical protein